MCSVRMLCMCVGNIPRYTCVSRLHSVCVRLTGDRRRLWLHSACGTAPPPAEPTASGAGAGAGAGAAPCAGAPASSSPSRRPRHSSGSVSDAGLSSSPLLDAFVEREGLDLSPSGVNASLGADAGSASPLGSLARRMRASSDDSPSGVAESKSTDPPVAAAVVAPAAAAPAAAATAPAAAAAAAAAPAAAAASAAFTPNTARRAGAPASTSASAAPATSHEMRAAQYWTPAARQHLAVIAQRVALCSSAAAAGQGAPPPLALSPHALELLLVKLAGERWECGCVTHNVTLVYLLCLVG